MPISRSLCTRTIRSPTCIVMSCRHPAARMSRSVSGSASSRLRWVPAASPTPKPNVISGSPCSCTTTSHDGCVSLSRRAAYSPPGPPPSTATRCSCIPDLLVTVALTTGFDLFVKYSTQTTISSSLDFKQDRQIVYVLVTTVAQVTAGPPAGRCGLYREGACAMAYVIGVDVGGTFTDAVLDDDAGTILAAKSPSTPPDYSRGVLDVLELLAEQLGVSQQDMLAGTHHIAHGTTSSLNALVMGNVPPVGFLTTKGHRDSIFIMNVEGQIGRAH